MVAGYHREAELPALVQILKAKYYGFPKREPDEGLWEPRGSWDLGLSWGMAEAGTWIESGRGWHLAWVCMDMEEVWDT